MEESMALALKPLDSDGWADTAQPEPPAIVVRALAKTYPGGVEAVKAIDFEVETGEVFGLLGPNGAGKSTTIGMLTTTVRPTSGSATLVGHDVASEPLGARAASSVVFQDPVVDRSLTGRRNLEIHARLWRVPQAEAAPRIGEIAAAVGVEELLERPVSTYSGGQRRRLEIARALVSHPRVLFLDEPTVGLDPRIRAELLDVISGLRARYRMTILLTTHYLDEADRLCDRIAVMHLGEIVACDSPEALRATLGDEILELRIEGDGRAALDALRAESIADCAAFAVGSTVAVPLRERRPVDVLSQIHALGVTTQAVTTRLPTLDDVYLRLTGGRLRADA
jgi:ABC-2 type transport system ATP-binding protein